jgi:ectoine hydroxylase-related dioxygenase (phytanoyl-CoA dioxygenase family)
MSPDLTDRAQFEDQGYLVLKGVFDSDIDLRPLKKAFEDLVAELAPIYLSEIGKEGDWCIDEMPLAKQIAVLLGASRGTALHHLDPGLNIFAPDYTWRPDLPNPRVPELFHLMRHPKLLDAIEDFIGPEITATPLYHFNQNLARRRLTLADKLAKSIGADISNKPFYRFQVGKTDWHMDAIAGLPDSHESNIVNAWIPLTPATEANGCMMVIPGSHKFGVSYPPYPLDLDGQGIALPVNPGDVIFFHSKVMHCSVANTSEDDIRWAFNFRYLKTGQPSGRPYLPGFVARSRTEPEAELHDAELWRLMWVAALNFIAENGVPNCFKDLRNVDLDEAREITRRWTALTPDPEAWLNLGQN